MRGRLCSSLNALFPTINFSKFVFAFREDRKWWFFMILLQSAGWCLHKLWFLLVLIWYWWWQWLKHQGEQTVAQCRSNANTSSHHCSPCRSLGVVWSVVLVFINILHTERRSPEGGLSLFVVSVQRKKVFISLLSVELMLSLPFPSSANHCCYFFTDKCSLQRTLWHTGSVSIFNVPVLSESGELLSSHDESGENFVEDILSCWVVRLADRTRLSAGMRATRTCLSETLFRFIAATNPRGKKSCWWKIFTCVLSRHRAVSLLPALLFHGTFDDFQRV